MICNGILLNSKLVNQVDDQVAKQQCVARNNRDRADHLMPQHIAIQELPTLTEIEELCLRQRPHRAAGLDGLPPEVCRHAAVVIAPFIHNVLLKAFVSGVEPFRYKGGLLVPIWKHKQSRQLASAYRGILLADVFGKVLHAWTRKRLLSTLLQRKAPGQIGGLPVSAGDHSGAAFAPSWQNWPQPTPVNSCHLCGPQSGVSPHAEGVHLFCARAHYKGDAGSNLRPERV